MKLEKIKPFLAMAFMLATESKATRRKCAALLLREVDGVYVIISSGVNGTAPNEPNVYEQDNVTLDTVIHAERNCLDRAPETRHTDIMVITDSPCENCLNLICKDYGIQNIVFGRSYRIREHLDHEDFAHVNISHVPMETELFIQCSNTISSYSQAAS